MNINTIALIVPTEVEAAHFTKHGLRAHICGVGMAECAASAVEAILTQRPDLVILAGIAGAYTQPPPEHQPAVGLTTFAGNDFGQPAIGQTVIVASETVADLGRREPDGGFTPFFQKRYESSSCLDETSGFATLHSNTVSMAGGLRAANTPLTESASQAPRAKSVPQTPLAPVAAIENMEGAAFFAVCARLGVRAMEVRTVSNRVGEAISRENFELSTRQLAADTAKIVSSLRS